MMWIGSTLGLNDIELMLNTAYEKSWRPAKPDTSRIDAHRDTGLYFGCRDLDAAFSYFVEKGIKLEGPSITGYGWRAINFFDPDGYHLWFHWPVE